MRNALAECEGLGKVPAVSRKAAFPPTPSRWAANKLIPVPPKTAVKAIAKAVAKPSVVPDAPPAVVPEAPQAVVPEAPITVVPEARNAVVHEAKNEDALT